MGQRWQYSVIYADGICVRVDPGAGKSIIQPYYQHPLRRHDHINDDDFHVGHVYGDILYIWFSDQRIRQQRVVIAECSVPFGRRCRWHDCFHDHYQQFDLPQFSIYGRLYPDAFLMAGFMYIGGLNPGSQTYTSGSGTFTVPAYTRSIRFRLWGAGSGGAGLMFFAGSVDPSSPGGNTTINTAGNGVSIIVTAGGGTRTGAGGTATNGDINTSGSSFGLGGGGDAANTAQGGGTGASDPAGGSTKNGNNGNPYGGGGSGSVYFNGTTSFYAHGGGGGAFAEKVFNVGDLSASGTVSWAVGTAGPGGVGAAATGGSGAPGGIQIDWDY
jgi:hypothetical protein